jgi:S1-C subfamily serine protease
VSGGAVIDILLVVALLAYAVVGARRGFVQGIFSLLGFVIGGVAGLVLVPRVVEALAGDRPTGLLAPGLGRVVSVVLAALLLAWVGQSLGTVVGSRLRSSLTWTPARMLDRAAGAVVGALVIALLAWFVAGALRSSPPPALARAIGQSKVVAGINQVMPPGAGGVAKGFREVVESGGFPRVFSGLGPELILPIEPPDRTEVAGSASAAAGSIVKITGLAASCGRGQEGTGFVVAPQRVVTNAHVVAGVREPVVRVGGEGRRYGAEVVLLDPQRDLAVLRVPKLPAAPLRLGEDLGRGDPAMVAGFPLDGPYTAAPARVRQVLTAQGENIYGQAGVNREVYSLYAKVELGNSGGPLMNGDGEVVGVVFAKSLDDPNTGYALTLAESMPVIKKAADLSARVPVGSCAAR